ncbi:MAG: hypothetical protein HKN80_14480 [Acidimicrobiia bacterium]|nr:hypothetical protein [Acidimicrobiia bacterium]
MTDDDMPVNEEHFDSIPWSSLIPQRQDRPWLVYVAAAAVVALVVGVLAARNLQSASQPLDPVEVATEDLVESVASPPTSRLITEADLQADIQHGEAGAVAAAMRAEWFVTDYFTRDGAGGRQAELAGALGRPAPATEAEITTYVEWARAWDAAAESDGRYRVAVAFRSITATDAGFVRDIAKGVAVRVQVAADGGSRVVDLPEPIEMPSSPVLAALASPEPTPEWVATKALDQAASWGESATVVEGITDGGYWRVLIESTDTHGTIWPLVVWVNESDQP